MSCPDHGRVSNAQEFTKAESQWKKRQEKHGDVRVHRHVFPAIFFH